MPTRPTSYNEHTLRVLEFDGVRDIVASFARSAEGRELMLALTPIPDAGSARASLAEVGECLDVLRFDDPFPALGIPDLRGLLPRLRVSGTVLDPEEIAAVAESLDIAEGAAAYLAGRAAKYPLLAAIADAVVPHSDLVRDIRRAITPDFEVADDASPELRSIRRRLGRARADLRGLVERKLGQLADEIVSERTITLRSGRYVIPVRDNMKRQVPGAVHDRSQTGRTLFIEPLEAIEGNNEIRELELAEHAEIARILAELSGRITLVAGDLEANRAALVRLDAIAARARYGAAVDGVIPLIGDTPSLTIRRGRHPLLDWKLRKRGEADKIVPLDLSIGRDTRMIVITGPNAGGKTVALKTAGLLVLMALAGLPVPAAVDTGLYAPPQLFADIGDEQSIADDLSTFSSHMKHIVTIVRETAPGTLVILDELGGGTNPADGEAIALAVLRKLLAAGTVTLATSHHDGLKRYAHETDGVMNASMEFDTEQHRPAFVLRTGVPGSSYAFEIAARMGMPEEVLDDAMSLAGGERTNLAGLIAELEDRLRQAAADREAADTTRRELERRSADLERKLAEFDKKRNELIAAAVEESDAILADTNRRIESAIREIREQNATHEAIVAAKEAVRETVSGIEEKRTRIPRKKPAAARSPLTELAAGQDVWVTTMNTGGVVEKVMSGGRARIRIGTSKATLVIDRKNLAAPEPSQKKTRQKVVVSTPPAAVDSLEIDLRGMTFDDAREELEDFIAGLSASGAETGRIIHGKGTGALRIKIGAYLDRHRAVASHRLGNWNEGSYGVTVITLKG